MTPADLRVAMALLRFSEAGLARALRLGKHGAKTVRRWKSGENGIPGPVQVLLETWLRARDTAIGTGSGTGANGSESGEIDSPQEDQ
jgi:hypothetical protein